MRDGRIKVFITVIHTLVQTQSHNKFFILPQYILQNKTHHNKQNNGSYSNSNLFIYFAYLASLAYSLCLVFVPLLSTSTGIIVRPSKFVVTPNYLSIRCYTAGSGSGDSRPTETELKGGLLRNVEEVQTKEDGKRRIIKSSTLCT